MGGNQNCGNNDPFAKIKFTMIHFASTADPEAYFDWELAVEQNFNSHLVPPEHRVRLATGEFTSFALFWWNDLCNAPNNANVIPLNLECFKTMNEISLCTSLLSISFVFKIANLKTW